MGTAGTAAINDASSVPRQKSQFCQSYHSTMQSLRVVLLLQALFLSALLVASVDDAESGIAGNPMWLYGDAGDPLYSCEEGWTCGPMQGTLTECTEKCAATECPECVESCQCETCPKCQGEECDCSDGKGEGDDLPIDLTSEP